jgi:integrase
MKAPLITAICTGLRAQNVMQLDWSEIDMQARMITVRIKSKKPRGRELSIPIAQPLFLELANLGTP